MGEGARQSVLRGVLAVLLLPGTAVAAVERTVLKQEDLSRRVSSNFYVVGFCESLGPECDTLQDLLEASDAALGGSSSSSTLRHMLLLQRPEYWAAALGTSQSTDLWFACHDGTTIQMTPLPRPSNTTADTQHSTSTGSSSSSAQQRRHAKECSKGSSCTATPGDGTKDPQWYLDPTVSKADRLDLLLAAAAQAAELQGAACIKGQLQHAMANPSAAALAQTRQQLSSLPSPAGRGSHKTPAAAAAAAAQQAAAGGGGGFSLMQHLERAFNTAMVLLAVFAAGRFWPQISALYLRLAGTSPPPPPHSTTTPVGAAAAAAPTAAAAAAAGGGGDSLPVVPEKLTIFPPAAPASLPSAPTTPARIITQHQSDGGLTSPVPLTLALNPGGIPSALEGPGGRALSTAASLDQLQMDNAQLAELVSQLHSEVGGSRAAAADATAAVHRQQAATQEALCCLQEQLVELETRITVVEEFGTAFNAAAAAAASVAQQHQQHQQQRQQEDSPLSRYASCIEVHSGSSSSGSAAAGDSASPFAMAAQGSTASTSQRTPPAAAAAVSGEGSAAAPSAASKVELQQAQQRVRANKVSASGAAAAAAAAAAASAAATAAAAAARGGAATEAALQQLCDLLARQGVATVGALESLTVIFTHSDTAAAAAAVGEGSAAAGEERNSPGRAEAADAAAALLQAHLGTLRIATTGIAALSDSLRGLVRPPMASSTGAAAAAATTPAGTAGGSSMVTPTTQVGGAAAGAAAEGLVTPEKASALPHSSHAGSPSPLPTPQPRALALGVSGAGDVGVELASSPVSPAASLSAAGGSSCKVPVQPVSPVEAEAAAATWAELQSRIRGGDRRSSSSGSSTAYGSSSVATPAAAAPLTGTAAAVGAGSAGSDGWEEVVVTEEVKRVWP